ncbi:MAG TPA: cupin domain-containing protein [Streptosporangiaceae bacterium]
MTLEAKNLDLPDDKRSFEHGEVLMVRVADTTIARAVLRPGWRWSTDVKPLVGTSSCELAHTAYLISGRMRVQMNDGTEAELAPGDAHYVSPGHDAWVVGDQPCVVVDFTAAAQMSGGGSRVTCPCGVEFRVNEGGQLNHLIAAVQQHASSLHGHDLTREHILSELQPA